MWRGGDAERLARPDGGHGACGRLHPVAPDHYTEGCHNRPMSDQQIEPFGGEDGDSAAEIVPGSRIDGKGWRLWIDEDGWYLARTARRCAGYR